MQQQRQTGRLNTIPLTYAHGVTTTADTVRWTDQLPHVYAHRAMISRGAGEGGAGGRSPLHFLRRGAQPPPTFEQFSLYLTNFGS